MFGNLENLNLGMGLQMVEGERIPSKYAAFEGIDIKQNWFAVVLVLGFLYFLMIR